MVYQKGFVRNWVEDNKIRKSAIDTLTGEPWSKISSFAKSQQSQFRQNFEATVFDSKTGTSSLTKLAWGTAIQTDVSGTTRRVPIKYEDETGDVQKGFIQRKDVATLQFVTPSSVKPFQKKTR